MDLRFSEEQEAIRETARSIVKRLEPRRDQLRKSIFVDQVFPPEIWDAMADAGLMGALIPTEYGGSGLGLLPLALAIEQMAGEGYAGALVVVTAMDTACILRNGSEALKKRILPNVASGKLKLCFALTEANAGTNAFRIATRAQKTKDGDYILSGEKTFITGADVADLMLVVTRTTTPEECKAQGFPKTFGFSLFLVDPNAKGISKTRLNTRGIEGYKQWTIHFDQVHVSKENLVGEQDAGSIALFNSLNPERILAATIACGFSDYLIRQSVKYANERKLFRDTPIGAYQGVSHPLADLQIELEATRWLAYHAAWAFDQELSPDEVAYWGNSAKYKASELGVRAADRAIQTHGGAGFDEDLGIIHYWNAVRLLKTAPINNEMILNFIAEHKLGLPRSY